MSRLNEAHLAAMQEALTEALPLDGVDPAVAASVVQYLELNGFALVPKTIIGIAGWTPAEERAYQMGIMYERFKSEIRYPEKV